MRYKNFFFSVLLLSGMFLAMGEYVLYVVDPIGIWGAPIRVGWNHYKVKQEFFTDIFKPYEYYRYQPDVIYIGTSKVQRGFDTVSEPEKKEYNLSMPDFSLIDIREYLRFAYRVHAPKKIYLGIDLSLFNQDVHFKRKYYEKPSFSMQRLHMIAMGEYGAFLCALKDSLSLLQYVPDTIQASRANRDKRLIHERGWYREYGMTDEVWPDVYYNAFNSVNLRTYNYKDFQYAPEAMECLKEILHEAEDRNIEVVLFFNPVHVDDHTVLYLTGHEKKWNEIKNDVAHLHPVYDFDIVSERTLDIKHNWSDFFHYNKKFGDKIKNVFDTQQLDEIAYLLTCDNAEHILQKEQQTYELWRSQNSERIDLLRYYVVSEQVAPLGAFQQFIGF